MEGEEGRKVTLREGERGRERSGGKSVDSCEVEISGAGLDLWKAYKRFGESLTHIHSIRLLYCFD